MLNDYRKHRIYFFLVLILFLITITACHNDDMVRTNPEIDQTESLKEMFQTLETLGYRKNEITYYDYYILGRDLPPLIQYTDYGGVCSIGLYDYQNPDGVSVVKKILEFEHYLEDVELEKMISQVITEQTRVTTTYEGVEISIFNTPGTNVMNISIEY